MNTTTTTPKEKERTTTTPTRRRGIPNRIQIQMKKLSQKHKGKKKRLVSRIPNRHPFYLDEVESKQSACCSKKCMSA